MKSRPRYGIFLFLFAQAGWSAQLDIADPWIRAAPPSSRVLAGYVALTNPSKKPVTITRVTSTAFAGIEMHATVVEKGVARMQQETTVTVPPGGQFRFEPNGRHLMLMDPRVKLPAGATAPLIFTFDDATTQSIVFAVREDSRAINQEMDKHGQEHHHLAPTTQP